MAFKTVKELEHLFTFDTVGKTLEGIYVGVRKFHSEKQDKDFIVHTIENKKGEITAEFFGAGALDYLLKKVEKGTLIRITYEGLSAEEIDTAFGKKQIHQFNVEVDDGK
jgi:hypothetical protein